MLRSLNLARSWSAGIYNANNNTLHRRGSSNTRLVFVLVKPEPVMLLVLPTLLFLTKILPIIHISSPIIPILFFNFCCINDNDIHNS